VWVQLAPDVDPDALALASGQAGIAYARGDTFSLDGRGHDFALLAFASQEPARIEEGIARWAERMAGARRRRIA
jgi:DNA-binding transcriptional MocR family regulator